MGSSCWPGIGDNKWAEIERFTSPASKAESASAFRDLAVIIVKITQASKKFGEQYDGELPKSKGGMKPEFPFSFTVFVGTQNSTTI